LHATHEAAGRFLAPSLATCDEWIKKRNEMAMLSAVESTQTRRGATVWIVAGAVMYDSSTSAKLDSLTEAAAPGVAITKAGSIAFADADADADLTDIHTVGPVSASQGALGTLSPSVTTHTTAPAAARRARWM
jgi:hypothetical protein